MGSKGKVLKTDFASPERATDEELAVEIDYVNSYPVMTGLLDSIGGLLAILNKHRQLVALNDSLLRKLGVADPQDALGLRPGEVLGCVYSGRGPAGCGTSDLCSSCGAAIAIVSSLTKDEPVERTCALKAEKEGKEQDVVLNIKSCPIQIEGKRFLLLFLQDMTELQQKAALERTFFHDISNMLNMLDWSSELLVQKEPSRFASIIKQVSSRLLREVSIQRCLAEDDCSYQLLSEVVSLQQVFDELQGVFANHPAAFSKRLNFIAGEEAASFSSDISLLLRVLVNMLINACEATEEGGEVKVWAEKESAQIAFYVWNRKAISQQLQKRVFQRNFSSKEGSGRGLGTYSMKYFGEKILGGEVSFESSEDEGTTFRFAVPSA